MFVSQVSKIDVSTSGGLKPAVIKGDVEFSNVNFVYPSRPDIQVSEVINFLSCQIFTINTLHIPFSPINVSKEKVTVRLEGLKSKT